ncbi:MAG: ABC transporter substrate-binding protein [Armatimonadetes bacterium]|nr:ABC transporter substrate-binding protein [Armatimonadota bacterium]
MSREASLEHVLSRLSPTTRREFLKRVAVLGLSASAAQAFLIRNPLVVTAAPGPRRGGMVRVMGHHEISSLSPDDAGPLVHFVIVTQIHNALLEVNENFVLERVLAERYTAAPDGSVYTFHLRRGVKFHDGREFAAEDVKYTYEWYLNPANNAINAANFAGVDRIEIPDRYTVVVKMKDANAAFLRRGATTLIVPAHYHSRVGERSYKTAAMGTGPFRLKEWRPAEYTLLEAFDQHFRGRPPLDFLREEIVPEASVRAIGLRTGASDGSVWPLLAEDSLRFAGDRNFTVFRTITTGLNHFPINNDLPFFADKRVRQALMHAIDRQRLIDDVFKGTAVLAHANLSPAVQQWYNPNVKKYPYSPERAKALLTEAGWVPGRDGIRVKDGRRFSFTCAVITGDRVRRPEAEVVQQDLATVGVEMKIVEKPVATINTQLPRGELDASLFNWTYGGTGGEPDASATLRSGQLRNFSRYKNPRMDELLARGLREVDPAKRKRVYNEVQDLFAEDVPFLYMMYWHWFDIFSRRIKGLPTSALWGATPLYRTAYRWWIE